MKTTSSIFTLIAITTLLHAAPPQAATTSEDLAKRKVATEIYAPVSPYSGGLSRAMPKPSHRLEFQPQMLVEKESRLPFTITRHARMLKPTPELQGYVRLSDQAVFLLDPKTGNYRPAREDRRFAPPPQQQDLPLPKIEPAKPL